MSKLKSDLRRTRDWLIICKECNRFIGIDGKHGTESINLSNGIPKQEEFDYKYGYYFANAWSYHMEEVHDFKTDWQEPYNWASHTIRIKV